MNDVTQVLEEAIKESHSWAAVVMKPDEKRGVLDCVANVGLPKDWANITNKLDSSTGNGRCYLSGEPVLIEDVFIEQPDGGETYHYMSAIAVLPIKRDGKVMFTLEVIKDKKGARFTPAELKILEKSASKLAKE